MTASSEGGVSTPKAWADLDRDELTAILPHAVVLWCVGAVEQHGPHLPTGTDSLLCQTIAEAAAVKACAQGARVVTAPPLWLGASDHHRSFGGTLSLAAATMLSLLVDVLDSAARAGARRLLLLNGHGGNVGVCHAAAGHVAARTPLQILHADYWNLLPADDRPGGVDVPGHAGTFEASLLAACGRPTPAAERTTVPSPTPTPPGATLHDAAAWQRIDGWTGRTTPDPAQGRRFLGPIVESLTNMIVHWEVP